MAKRSLQVTDREIKEMFADPECAKKYPPLLDVAQAAELARAKASTIYDWSSRGLLDDCATGGRPLLVMRNRFVRFLLERRHGDRK